MVDEIGMIQTPSPKSTFLLPGPVFFGS